jgi:hypothetical protein
MHIHIYFQMTSQRVALNTPIFVRSHLICCTKPCKGAGRSISYNKIVKVSEFEVQML